MDVCITDEVNFKHFSGQPRDYKREHHGGKTHEEEVERRKRLRAIWRHHNIDGEVAFFGRPTAIADAQDIIDLYYESSGFSMPEWIGGLECDNSTLDINLMLPSKSQKSCEEYSLSGKYYPVKDNVYNLPLKQKQGQKTGIISIDHSCKCTNFEQKIKRLCGPCKHQIAFQIVVQQMYPFWFPQKDSENKVKGNKDARTYKGNHISILYKENPNVFFLTGRSHKIVDIRDKLKKKVFKEYRRDRRRPKSNRDSYWDFPSVVLEERLIITLKEKNKKKYTKEESHKWNKNLLNRIRRRHSVR